MGLKKRAAVKPRLTLFHKTCTELASGAKPTPKLYANPRHASTLKNDFVVLTCKGPAMTQFVDALAELFLKRYR